MSQSRITSPGERDVAQHAVALSGPRQISCASNVRETTAAAPLLRPQQLMGSRVSSGARLCLITEVGGQYGAAWLRQVRRR